MGRKNKFIKPLDDYTVRASDLLSKSESLTSHLLLSYLYYLAKIYPWHIVPQPNTKRGIIDFFYLPKDNSYNIFVEMKKFLTLNKTVSEKTSKYLRREFPKALKNFHRRDGIRLLIITDLKSISISVRRKEWGYTSTGYALPIVKYVSPKECAESVAIWLRKKFGEVCREIIWENTTNRYEVILRELTHKKHSVLSETIYKKWLKELKLKGARGRYKQLISAYKAQCMELQKHVNPEQKNAVKKVLTNSRIKKIVKNTFEDLGVKFKQGPVKNIFV